MNDQETLIELADLASELCDTREHVERIYRWTKKRNKQLYAEHRTEVAGLIEQLRQAVRGGSSTSDDGRRVIPSSRPPLLIEAVSKLAEIEVSVNEWIHHLRLANRGNAEDNIRALVGAAPEMGGRRELLADFRKWRGWAAVMSGWALPPYQPDVRCPLEGCGELGTIRIILERKVGLCVACEARWDERDGSIEVLARHIALETATERAKVPVGSVAQGHGAWGERRIALGELDAMPVRPGVWSAFPRYGVEVLCNAAGLVMVGSEDDEIRVTEGEVLLRAPGGRYPAGWTVPLSGRYQFGTKLAGWDFAPIQRLEIGQVVIKDAEAWLKGREPIFEPPVIGTNSGGSIGALADSPFHLTTD